MHEKSQEGQKIRRSKAGVKIFAFCCVIIVLMFALDFFGILNYNDSLQELGFVSTYNSSDFSVEYIDVGQGDSSLICQDGHFALVDTGDKVYNHVVSSELYKKGVKKLDFVILSHFHADHVSGIYEVIKNFDPDVIYIGKCDFEKSDIDINEFNKECKNNGVNVITVENDMNVSFNAASVTLLPTLPDDENLNNSSLVARVLYKNKAFLFAGDIEEKAEDYLLAGNADLSCDVLKVAHHGSNTSSSEKFLNACDPEAVVISCSYDNTFGHPSEKTVKRLYEFTSTILRTDILGNIIINLKDDHIIIDYN